MKIGLVSLGCPKNLVDGEVMLGYAQQAGHEITADAKDADVIVVNTCAFIDNAKQESIDAILEMAQHKHDGKRLVVTGCLAERYRDELKKEIPEIDALLGTGELPGIVEALQPLPITDNRYPISDVSRSQNSDVRPLTFHKRSSVIGHRASDIGSGSDTGRQAPTFLYGADTPRLITTPRHFAYVKIAEGCDYTCAFCIIPTLRGEYRSRTRDSIVKEARALAARGVKELLLISQDTTFYGIDRQERGALAKLLRELNDVEGLEWIRMLYLYPTTITDDVLAAMAECEKVCKYVDLPLQHASADVLKRMRRPGNRQTYDTLLARIRDRVPGVTLRTTFIVGFPGETADEFAQLEGFVEDTEFDHIGVFTYSHEEGTRAHAVADDVPAATKRRRRDRVMKRQQRIVAARLREAAERVAVSHGLEIFDVQLRREPIGMVLRVVIDKPDPGRVETPEESVGIADCQRVSQDLSALLDVEDEFGETDLGETYTLEVSSPGLDRALRHEKDYRRFAGRLAKIVTTTPIDRQSAFAGRIKGIEEGAVVLEEGRKTHRVPLDRIKRANLDVEF